MKELTYTQIKTLEEADSGITIRDGAIGGPYYRDLKALELSGHLLEAKIRCITLSSPMSLMYFLTDKGADALISALNEK